MHKRAPKIIDVARLAGVSTATVSRALSKPESVADSTRHAVLAAAAKSGYQVNLSARNLRRQKTGAIVVLVPNLGNPFFSEILSGIESGLSKADFNMLVVDTRHSHAKPHLVTNHLHATRADGIIALDGSLPDSVLEATRSGAGAPPIVFACEWTPSQHFASVRVDNARGAELAISHLVDLGHRSIGMVRGPDDNVLTGARTDGAATALSRHGLAFEPMAVFDGDFSIKAGARVGSDWLGLGSQPTAMFCQSDLMAFGFISELARSGVRVPEDVSVVGFDDIDIASRFIPALTTVFQPRAALGLSAAEMLIEQVNGRVETRDDIRVLDVELIVRDSTRALAG